MKIKGPKGGVAATSSGDTVIGGRGNDWIEGGAKDDTLTGGGGRDTFVLRSDSGHDVVTDFDISNPDLIMLDSQTGVYDGMLGSNWGPLWDGMQIVNSHGTSVATVHQADYNGDGMMDTQFAMDSGATLTSLSVLAAQITGYSLYGG
jgi:Ca2+-binding RTX toxin-like protein